MAEKLEIIYCNLKVTYKNTTITIPRVIWKNVDWYYRRQKVLLKYNIKDEKVKVVSFDVIKSLGYEN